MSELDPVKPFSDRRQGSSYEVPWTVYSLLHEFGDIERKTSLVVYIGYEKVDINNKRRLLVVSYCDHCSSLPKVRHLHAQHEYKL